MILSFRHPHLRHQPPTPNQSRRRRRDAAKRRLRKLGRKPFFDNTPVLLGGHSRADAGARRPAGAGHPVVGVRPRFLADVVLYALSATNLTILVALAFVLARNVVKLVVERRKALPFARFRFKLVTVLLGMTLIPAVLVLIIGSELIRNNVDRWFNADLDEVLSSANGIAGDYYAQQQRLVSAQAQRFARALRAVDLAAARPSVGARSRGAGRASRNASISSRSTGSAHRPRRGARSCQSLDVAAPSIPRQYSRASGGSPRRTRGRERDGRACRRAVVGRR